MSVPLSLAQRFAKYVVSNNLIVPSMKIVIAVSGGADSIALLHLLQMLKKELRLSLLAVHVNHHLRGDESDGDEQFVRRICNHLNVNCIVKHVEFTTAADLENQAREARLEILNKILKSYKFDKIALAHQKNDQAETILMNLTRGAGITGMGGIKPKTDSIIRPLFIFPRVEIERWMAENNIEWRKDISNEQTRFTRNRVRIELIPWLEKYMNVTVIDKLFALSTIFQDVDDYFKRITKKLLKKAVVDESDTHIALDLKFLRTLTKIELFYVLRASYGHISKTEHEFFMHSFDEIQKLFDSTGSKMTRLVHDVFVLKEYDELILTASDPVNRTFEQTELVIDEERTHFVFFNWRFTLKYLKLQPKSAAGTDLMNTALIDLNKVAMPLKLRGRLPGDRFVPLGMKSEKKLKDFFIDEKVSKFERDGIPILTDADKIVWVVGHRLDNRVICDENSQRILHITVEPVAKGRKRSANRLAGNHGGKNDIYEL